MPHSECNKLLPGETLAPGEELISASGRVRLRLQTFPKGRLLVYYCRAGNVEGVSEYQPRGDLTAPLLVMQPDGNLVLYKHGPAIPENGAYHTKTSGRGNFALLGDTGEFVVMSPNHDCLAGVFPPVNPELFQGADVHGPNYITLDNARVAQAGEVPGSPSLPGMLVVNDSNELAGLRVGEKWVPFAPGGEVAVVQTGTLAVRRVSLIADGEGDANPRPTEDTAIKYSMGEAPTRIYLNDEAPTRIYLK